MNLKIERLGQGERIAAGSALALFACMFLSWFNFGYTASNAWESLHYISPILAISIVATLGIAFAEVRELDIGDIPGGLVVFVLGCLSALLILLRLIDPISTPGIDGGSAGGSVEAGAFLAFIAAVGVAAGGYITTDGKAIDRLKALLPSGSGAPGGFPAAPPSAPRPQAPTATAAPSAPTPAAAVAPTPPAPSPPVSPPASAPPATTGVQREPAAVAESPSAPESPAEPDRTTAADPPDTAGAEAAVADPPSVFCEGCGAPLRTQDRFCRKCGHRQAQIPGPAS